MLSKGPFGGGMTTTKFSLRILYDEHLRFLNFWTVSNEDLDLCRYLGATLTVFRHPTVDFMLQIHTQPPFLDTQLTAPSIHPGMMILNKKHIFIPSLKSRPSKKHQIKIRIGAPRLYEDKWYPQSELCDVTLAVVYATACDLQYPFGSPLTDNLCVNFQVLNHIYKKHLSILSTSDAANKDHFDKNLFNQLSYYNTFQTIAQLKGTGTIQTSGTSNKWNEAQNTTTLNLEGNNANQSNDTWYKGNTYKMENIKQLAEQTRKRFMQATKQALNIVTISTDLYEYHSGAYSSIFLAAGRSYFETPGAYTDVVYNPLTDKGLGNMVWIDWLSKSDALYTKGQSKCEIFDLPLWAALNGYTEFCSKSTGDTAVHLNARLVIRCPYTYPMLVDHSNDLQGFVLYSKNFGEGKMPGGSSQVPIRMRIKWYPCLFHQQEVMEALVMSGPFAYKGDEKSCCLGIKYKFRFKWGGNPISKQVVRNPCRDSSSSARRGPRSIQAVDPKHVTPAITWHSWDIRRGIFGRESIKRVLSESDAFSIPTGPPKRSKKDTEVQREDSDTVQQPVLKPWIDSSQEAQSSQEESPPEGSIQDQLLQQLREQRLLRGHLQQLANQVLKVQAGHSLHPLLYSQA